MKKLFRQINYANKTRQFLQKLKGKEAKEKVKK